MNATFTYRVIVAGLLMAGSATGSLADTNRDCLRVPVPAALEQKIGQRLTLLKQKQPLCESDAATFVAVVKSIETLDMGNSERDKVVSLQKIGFAALPALEPLMVDSDPQTRWQALTALRYMLGIARNRNTCVILHLQVAYSAVTAMAERSLLDRDVRNRALSAGILSIIGAKCDVLLQSDVVPPLKEMMANDPDADVRERARKLLANLGVLPKQLGDSDCGT
ncbi:MAG: hypothetical protein WCL39_11445 [Armatimonadota bacterium]